MEAITVVRELKRLNEYFAIRRYGLGKMVEFGNINAYVKHEVVPPFLKSDTVISTSDYHRRLDGDKYS